MKRYISFVLSIILLSAVFSLFGMHVGASFPEPSNMNGYENLCLTYTWNPTRADNGRHSVEDLMPYVAYYDTDGNIKDFFFDSYLFLPCVKLGVSGASMHYDTSKPSRAVDWTAYVEDTFYDGANVDALDTAFGNAKEALNQPDKKAGVFLTILYPGRHEGSTFGTLGGKTLNLTNFEDRKYAIKWIIDEQLRLYTEAGYENLDLVGFYWLEEYLYGASVDIQKEDKQLFKYASDYLHSLGLKFIWIPYYSAGGHSLWQELGFDVACMQPNMYWQVAADKNRVEDCINKCNSLGMGVEIEIDYRAINNGEYYNRYLDYLEGCMQKGAMDSIKMYYQDGKNAVYYNAFYSTNERARSIYDLTYKYAKGTLTQEDIDAHRSEGFVLPDYVDWISIGKEYVATEPYSDGSKVNYQDNNGKELTDGILGVSDLGTEWHAFHVSHLDDDKRMNVTIDLGSVRNDLTHFMMQFSHVEDFGIDDPADDIKIYVSEDGEDFKLIAEPELEYVDVVSYINYVSAPITGRYVKFSLKNSNANFVFCGEALVGVTKSVTNENSDVPKESEIDSSSVASVGGADDTNVDTSISSGADGIWVIWIVSGIIAVILVISLAILGKKKNKK